MKGDNMSHEEIWDDSALQNSWDDALAEYKKYHSMAAKGEQVDLSELSKNEQTDGDVNSATDLHEQLPANGTSNATVEQPQTVAGAVPARNPTVTGLPSAAAQTTPAVPSNTPAMGSAMPQALLNTVQDEGLKNLMMSWYYAGYYTGLLEGQQKAFASMQEGA